MTPSVSFCRAGIGSGQTRLLVFLWAAGDGGAQLLAVSTLQLAAGRGNTADLGRDGNYFGRFELWMEFPTFVANMSISATVGAGDATLWTSN